MTEKNKIKKIIHVDMDAFFASVEMRDFPQYRGKPLIVGGSPDSRGVVSTCSYEARKFGIHSAMPSALAYKLCPSAIFVRGRFEAYREASKIMREIFYEYSDLVEPCSLDEAYIDVTENKKNIKSATHIAIEIREKILERTKLTASAGVSYNKFLAKIASDMNKPNGLTVIRPEEALQVLENLKIGKFHGIGKVTEKKMKSMGIFNGADLKKVKLNDMLRNFGKAGYFFYNIVRGIDNREVKINGARKSIGSERTFSDDIDDIELMLKCLKSDSEKIATTMIKSNISAKTITVKIKYANFEIASRSKTLRSFVSDARIIFQTAKNILQISLIKDRKIRLLGISLSNLMNENDSYMVQPVFKFYYESRTTNEYF